jgi:hypothetical protein
MRIAYEIRGDARRSGDRLSMDILYIDFDT